MCSLSETSGKGDVKAKKPCLCSCFFFFGGGGIVLDCLFESMAYPKQSSLLLRKS